MKMLWTLTFFVFRHNGRYTFRNHALVTHLNGLQIINRHFGRIIPILFYCVSMHVSLNYLLNNRTGVSYIILC